MWAQQPGENLFKTPTTIHCALLSESFGEDISNMNISDVKGCSKINLNTIKLIN
jgi:hypothetical protein